MQLAATQIFALIRWGEGRVFRPLPTGERSALTARRRGTSAGLHRLSSRDTSLMFPSDAAACSESCLIPGYLDDTLTAAIGLALSGGSETSRGRPPRRAGRARCGAARSRRGRESRPGGPRRAALAALRGRAQPPPRPITATGRGGTANRGPARPSPPRDWLGCGGRCLKGGPSAREPTGR